MWIHTALYPRLPLQVPPPPQPPPSSDVSSHWGGGEGVCYSLLCLWVGLELAQSWHRLGTERNFRRSSELTKENCSLGKDCEEEGCSRQGEPQNFYPAQENSWVFPPIWTELVSTKWNVHSETGWQVRNGNTNRVPFKDTKSWQSVEASDTFWEFSHLLLWKMTSTAWLLNCTSDHSWRRSQWAESCSSQNQRFVPTLHFFFTTLTKTVPWTFHWKAITKTPNLKKYQKAEDHAHIFQIVFEISSIQAIDYVCVRARQSLFWLFCSLLCGGLCAPIWRKSTLLLLL